MLNPKLNLNPSILGHNSDSKNYDNEKKFYELQREKMTNEQLSQNISQNSEVHKLRQNLAPIILTITVIWMILILIVIVAVGKNDLKLSDSVLITLITTTTANVFGFLYIVVKYYFPNNK